MTSRRVVLRDEQTSRDRRVLTAYLDVDGSLILEGQDLGPGTSLVSSDGEYEWWRTIRAEHLDRLVALLGGETGDIDLLDLLETRWSGVASYELESLIAESGIPNKLDVWSG